MHGTHVSYVLHVRCQPHSNCCTLSHFTAHRERFRSMCMSVRVVLRDSQLAAECCPDTVCNIRLAVKCCVLYTWCRIINSRGRRCHRTDICRVCLLLVLLVCKQCSCMLSRPLACGPLLVPTDFDCFVHEEPTDAHTCAQHVLDTHASSAIAPAAAAAAALEASCCMSGRCAASGRDNCNNFE